MSSPYHQPVGVGSPHADVQTRLDSNAEVDRYDGNKLAARNGIIIEASDREYVTANVRRYHGDQAKQIGAFATATLRRAVPKVRGKRARKADKLARREARNRLRRERAV